MQDVGSYSRRHELVSDCYTWLKEIVSWVKRETWNSAVCVLVAEGQFVGRFDATAQVSLLSLANLISAHRDKMISIKTLRPKFSFPVQWFVYPDGFNCVVDCSASMRFEWK